MPDRITIADVAREAGVSMMTVSRVLNNKPGVGEETRLVINEVIKRLGYRPNQLARGLATQHTGTIGLVIPDVSNPFFSNIALAIEKVAYSQGYNVLLCNTEENSQREMDILRMLAEKWVDGLVLCSTRLKDEELFSTIPLFPAVVLVNRQLINHEGNSPVGTILVEDHEGGLMAVRHLINSGHKKIGFLSGPVISQSSQWRLDGYKEALAESGFPLVQEYIISCPPTVEGGIEAGSQLLAAHPEITALFCYNDLTAVGVLQACAKMGKKVPDDLAVVGFDDIILAPMVTPALTTIRVPREEMGEMAIQLLLERMSGCMEECEKKVLQPELIIRASAP